MVDHEFDAAPDPNATQGLKLPGIFLVIFATLALLLNVVSLVGGPSIWGGMLDWVEGLIEAEESMPEENKQELLDQIEQAREVIITQQYSLGTLVQTGVLLLISLLVLLGGVQMITGGSWGLAMTGSILALIPCLGPCCGITLPFGIWGLVVLMKDDVKRAMG